MSVAIVTGGRSGIGREVARKLHKDGFTVYVPGRKPFEEEGITFLPADVTREDMVEAAVQTIVEKEGRIDLLVNCAGYGLMSATEFTPLSEAKKQFDVLFFGCVNMTKAVLPYMRKQGSGRVVNVSSMAAAAPLPFQNYYSAAKAALNAYTDSLRTEVSPYGIDCCVILPGDTATGFTDARETVLAGDDSYGGRVEKSMRKQADYEKKGAKASTIGGRIAAICEKKHLRRVYTVDPVSGIEYALIKFLPHDLSAAVIGKMYGES